MTSAKPASASACVMTEFVLPSHANSLGSVFGGTIMSWVDLCAAIAAQRHARCTVVTAFVDDLLFQGPVRVGEVVQLRAEVTATFNTSMEVEVHVLGEHPSTGQTWPCVHAYLTFVAVAPATLEQSAISSGSLQLPPVMTPVAVPSLLLDTDEARAKQAAGAERRALRLARSKHLKHDPLKAQ